MEYTDPHICNDLRRIYSTLEDVTVIKRLPIFGDRNAMVIGVEAEDEKTPQLLTFALLSSKTLVSLLMHLGFDF